MLPSLANDNTPNQVDVLLIQYLPGLKKLARKLSPREPEELLSETIVTILHRRGSYRPEGGGFWLWAVFTMRGVRRDRMKKAARRIHTVGMEKAWNASTQPAQEHAVDLGTVRAHVGGVLARRVSGCKLQDIANDRGLSRERIRQIEKAEREHVVAAVGWGG